MFVSLIKKIYFLVAVLSLSVSNHAHAFSRIITLAPALSEWTALILGEKETSVKIVGVSGYSFYPDTVKKIQSVGPYHKLNIEKIASLKPDLIIGSSEYNRPEQLEQLKRLKLPLHILPGEKFSDMPAWIRNLGEILNEQKASLEPARQWTKSLEDLKASSKLNAERRFFIEIQHLPLITVGGESFLNDAFKVIHYENVFGDLEQAYPKVSKEAVLKKNPDNIFILSLVGNDEDFAEAKNDWERFKDLKAVVHQKIKILSGDNYARCSLRLLKALKQLN